MNDPALPGHDDRVALRRILRARRRAITGAARERAARQVARRIDAARWLRAGSRIGLYLSMREELDTGPLLQLAARRGCRIALPRILSARHNRMAFFDFAGPLHPGPLRDGSIRRGAFGIAEPRGGRRRSALTLDVVFLPLVGFDPAGHRIGMGRGFYDRHFAHRGRLTRWRRPLLVGIAYDAQCVPALPVLPHDIPLDAIVTESTVLRIREVPT